MQRRLQPLELDVQLRLGDRIERAERLVHQQQRRIRGQRARQADALPLSARQFVGPSIAVGRRRQADHRQQLVDARDHFAPGHSRSRGTIAMLRATVMCGKRPASWMT